jgi:hypothetical protein
MIRIVELSVNHSPEVSKHRLVRWSLNERLPSFLHVA